MGSIPKTTHHLWFILARSSLYHDVIPKELFSCTYETINQTISQLKLQGQGALMSKPDLSDAFRQIF